MILDINLIAGSGLEVLKPLKKNTASIIISANNSLEDKLEGLVLGADDYLTKTFHLAELIRASKQFCAIGNSGAVRRFTLTKSELIQGQERPIL